MLERGLNFSVLVDDKPIKEYFHDGNFFVEGRKGSEFKIQLTNNSNMKLKAIISVDGLSIVDGEPAGVDSDGYVLDPYQTYQFDGWRTSYSTISKFLFSKKGKSYANRIDQDVSNVGVIGVMTFREMPTMLYRSYNPIWTSSGFGNDSITVNSGGYVYNTSTSCSTQNIGTGFGDTKTSHASQDFSTFDTTIDQIMCMYYDDRKGLEKRGIVLDETKLYPNAFPKYLTSGKFAKIPQK